MRREERRQTKGREKEGKRNKRETGVRKGRERGKDVREGMAWGER